MKAKLLAAVLFAASLFGAGAVAQDTGLYISAHVGYAELGTDSLTANGISVKVDDAPMYGFDFGYMVTPNFGVEAGYRYVTMDFGGHVFVGRTASSFGGELEISGLTAGVVGVAPLNETFELYGRLGIFAASADAEISGRDFEIDDGTQAYAAAGARFRVGYLATLGVEYSYYDIEDELGSFNFVVNAFF